MKTVFISRNLHPESVFLQKLTSEGYEVYGESLILFEAIPFETVPFTEWIFFSSQNAVRFFEEGLFNLKMPFSTKKMKLAGIGKATSDAVKKTFGYCDFEGDGNPETTAKAFLAVAKNQKVLFPSAQKSRRSIQVLLEGQIEGLDLLVYDNLLKTDFELPNFEVLVFTSPLNVEAFFSKKPVVDDKKVVVIGRTTGKALERFGVLDYTAATEASELGLAEAVLAG